MNRGLLAAVLVATAVITATAFPLLTYSLTLATFGLAHAVVELRVLDVRYRSTVAAGPWRWVLLALVGVFAIRIAANLGVVPRSSAHVLELVGGVAATLAVVPWLVQRRPAAARGGLLVAAALVAGVIASPLVTLLVLAVLHNLTPCPLLLDTLTPQRRAAGWTIGALVFVVMPLVIASGVLHQALGAVGVMAPEATLLPTGPLFDQFGAFWGPAPLDHPYAALYVFSACAYLQCAHYVAVLLLLPGASDVRRNLAPRTVGVLVGTGAAIGIAYAVDFASARSWYGTIAGVHAWAEFPALLVVWAGWQRAQPLDSRSKPNPNDAALATSAVTNAGIVRTTSAPR